MDTGAEEIGFRDLRSDMGYRVLSTKTVKRASANISTSSRSVMFEGKPKAMIVVNGNDVISTQQALWLIEDLKNHIKRIREFRGEKV